MFIKKIRNVSFRIKMTFIFTIVCTFCSCVAGIIYYNFEEHEIVENFTLNAESLVNQLEDTLDTRLEAVNRRAFAALTNSSFIQPFEEYLSVPNTKKESLVSGEAANWLKDIRMADPLVNSTFLYTEKGCWDDYTKNRNWDFIFEDSSYYKYFQEDEEKAVQWLPAMEDEIFKGEDMVIPYVRHFTVGQNRKTEVYMIIQLDQEILLKEIIRGENKLGQILITDDQGRYIAGNVEIQEAQLREIVQEDENQNKGNREEGSDGNQNGEGDSRSSSIIYGGESCLMYKGSVDVSGWRIYLLKSRKELLDSMKVLRRLIVGMTLALMLVSLLVVSILSRQMTSSLRRLSIQMTRVRDGERDARFYYPYKDEVGKLARAFNYMADEIEKSMKKQEEYIAVLKEERDYAEQIQKQKRRAELRALQAQINPHFLYNTLNMITWLASDKGVDEIRILSNSLGRFFRISLSKGAETILVRDEIEHVKSYLTIQEIRYAEMMDYKICMEESLMGCRILKLTLQPLVENSIYHGIKLKGERCTISITGKRMEEEGKPAWIELSVEDDGAGIPPEKLENINQGLKEGLTDTRDGYGIFNVNERIKLYYGGEYGLRYESVMGQWTRAILTIPADVQEDDSCISY